MKLLACFLFALVAWGVPSRVQFSPICIKPTQNTSDLACTLPGFPVVGNVLAIGLSSWQSGSAPVVTITDGADSGSNVYYKIGADSVARAQLFFAPVLRTNASGTFTFTVHVSQNASLSVGAIEYSGLSTTPPVSATFYPQSGGGGGVYTIASSWTTLQVGVTFMWGDGRNATAISSNGTAPLGLISSGTSLGGGLAGVFDHIDTALYAGNTVRLNCTGCTAASGMPTGGVMNLPAASGGSPTAVPRRRITIE